VRQKVHLGMVEECSTILLWLMYVQLLFGTAFNHYQRILLVVVDVCAMTFWYSIQPLPKDSFGSG
jgi:hypothetical protein